MESYTGNRCRNTGLSRIKRFYLPIRNGAIEGGRLIGLEILDATERYLETVEDAIGKLEGVYVERYEEEILTLYSNINKLCYIRQAEAVTTAGNPSIPPFGKEALSSFPL